uniref:Elongation factor 1-delta n=1 Tax=Oncorhynchus tshawytscha TaxID=74940 RepID=A0A8C8F5A4_ONCTS
MSAAVDYLAQEKIWFDKPRYHEAERHFYEHMNGTSHPAQVAGGSQQHPAGHSPGQGKHPDVSSRSECNIIHI